MALDLGAPLAEQIVALAAEDERRRLERIKRAWRCYEGDLPRPLRLGAEGRDDNLPINFPRLIVDKTADFLFGEEPKVSLPEEQESSSEEWLDQAWSRNRSGQLFTRLGTVGAIAGHAFVKIVPPGDPSGFPTFPRLILLDPSTVTVVWDQEDYERILEYRVTWAGVDPQTQRPFARRQISRRANEQGSAWEILDQISRGESAKWETLQQVPWPYPWAPIVDAQNLPAPAEFWGLSDLEPDLLDLNDGLIAVASNINRIVRLHAHPKPIGRGIPPEIARSLDFSADTLTALPSPDAAIENLEMRGDLSAALALYARLKETIHEISRTPAIATGQLENVGNLSGLALQILYGPLIDKTEVKRRTYGRLLEDLSARMLALGRQISPPAVEETAESLQVAWPELLPSDPESEARTLDAHESLGVVSKRTISEKLGYDYDAEQARMEEEAASSPSSTSGLQAFARGFGFQTPAEAAGMPEAMPPEAAPEE